MFAAYLPFVFIWICILVPIALIIYTIIKRTPLLISIIGILLALSALPIAHMAELSIGGCCGAPSNGREGQGYLIGAAVAVVGVLLIVFRNKLAKKKP